MKITRDEVLHVAELARLDMDEAAMETLAPQIAEILEYIDMLNRIDTREVTPTSHAIPIENAFREDALSAHLATEKALANAPAMKDGHFLVPKVIG